MIHPLLFVLPLLFGGCLYFRFITRKPKKERPVSAPTEEEPPQEAEKTAREIILEAKEEALRLKKEAEEELRRAKTRTFEEERKLAQKEGALEQKETLLLERERALAEKEKRLERKIKKIERLRTEAVAKLEKIGGLTREEARKRILGELRRELKEEIAKQIKSAEEEAVREIDRKTKELLGEAMLRAATDYVVEYTVSTVHLPNEEMKGRIIGREGRNIRALERATGVDFDIDETPNQIRLSCFDPIRREIAKLALQRLIADGRIQPTRIEETVEKAKRDVARIIHQAGEELCHKVGVYDLPRGLVDLLGRFKFRFSYGQNMIAHTLEETKLGVALAEEIRAKVEVVRRGCLLHDIGKVVTEEEGNHVELGVKVLKRYNLPQEIITCVAEHHSDQHSTIESAIVAVADAISGARPGARLETLEEYTARLTKLEEIAKSFDGVADAFAISAGRELRVLVKPEEIDDDQAVILAREIKKKIEAEKRIAFPGQVKVVVIREKRAVETAF